MVASALCVLRSSESTTWESRSSFLPSPSLPILANPASSFFNCAGACSTCLPVYMISMKHLVGAGNIPFLLYSSNQENRGQTANFRQTAPEIHVSPDRKSVV